MSDNVSNDAASPGYCYPEMARGLARQFGRDADKSTGQGAKALEGLVKTFFPRGFMKGATNSGMSARRLKPEDFNRSRLLFERNMRKLSNTLWVSSSPYTRTQPGEVSWLATAKETVDIDDASGKKSYKQWTFIAGQVIAESRHFAMLMWIVPVIVSEHVIERLYLREAAMDDEKLKGLLASMVTSAAATMWALGEIEQAPAGHADHGDDFDIAVPLPAGGAVMGGFARSECLMLQMGKLFMVDKNGPAAHIFPNNPLPSRKVVHLRTYMDEAILEPEQRPTVADLRDVFMTHGGFLSEPAVLCCPIPGVAEVLPDGHEEWRLRLLAAIGSASQTFNHNGRRRGAGAAQRFAVSA